ncbi:DUF4173 domain-containing protein [Actinomadura sp. ATCC 31491]|uniref:Signal transduction histidine-protein kinase/phosphatase MprB n=1 Tax=Actinomadura luzonensis TaxID=2805427 RepID=A0ABT0G9D1_9ACTN|nr:DUF4153 domain-containing protein [Actinomadura luzonensis]MCK2220998.1 DUF4173 domain-containing protein [Actinomadura luzonensis]
MRPLDFLGRIKVKLGIVIVLAVGTAFVVNEVGLNSGLSREVRIAVAVVLALIMVQLLAMGMTKPLRQMARAAQTIAKGHYKLRVSATSRDEVGELARAFNAMAADLAEVDRQRRELVANVSHELRTPITGLRAVLENVVDGVSAPDPVTMATALAQTERLGRLVAQLLDLSRLDSGARLIEAEAVALAPLFEQAVREAGLAREDVTIRAEAPPDLVVRADPDLLAQVLANLLDNAVRHSPAGGAVTVRGAARGAGVLIAVADHGPGIPEAARGRVFERFSRLDSGRAADSGGAGLGLAIVKEIVELHGGSVRIDDGPGCRMVVELPGRTMMTDGPEGAGPERVGADGGAVSRETAPGTAGPAALAPAGAVAAEGGSGQAGPAPAVAPESVPGGVEGAWAAPARAAGPGTGTGGGPVADGAGAPKPAPVAPRAAAGAPGAAAGVGVRMPSPGSGLARMIGGGVVGVMVGFLAGMFAAVFVSVTIGDGLALVTLVLCTAGAGSVGAAMGAASARRAAALAYQVAHASRPAGHFAAALWPLAPVPHGTPGAQTTQAGGLEPAAQTMNRPPDGAGGRGDGAAVHTEQPGGTADRPAAAAAGQATAGAPGQPQAAGTAGQPQPAGTAWQLQAGPPQSVGMAGPAQPVGVGGPPQPVGGGPQVASSARPVEQVYRGQGGPPAYVPPPLFPRPELPETPRWLLPAAGGAGVFAAVALPEAQAGLGFVLVAMVLGAAALPAVVRRMTPWTVAFGLTAYWLISMAAVRDADWLVTVLLMAGAGLGALAVSGAGAGWLGVLRGGLSVLLALGPVPWFLAVPLKRLTARRRVMPMVAALGLTVVLLLVFGLLFASADAVFASYAERLMSAPDWAESLPGRIVLFVVFAVLLAAVVLVALRPVADPVGPAHRFAVSRAVWLVPLTAVNVLFALFVAVQITALFGGNRLVLRTAGLTYAEYARQGFFQLVVVSVFVLGIVAAAAGLLRTGRRERWVLAVLLGVLCGLTMVVLASALHRMNLYTDAYGLSRLRLSVQATVWWLGAVFALVLLAGAVRLAGRGSGWLPRVIVLVTGLGVGAFALVNPDLQVAATQVEVRGVTKLDSDYLGDLGAEAVPALDRLPEPQRSCVLADVIRANELDRPDPWNGWNLARAKARDLLAAHPLHSTASCEGRASGRSD